MADIRESSLLFSLNRLMEHEKERVLEEQRDRELKSAQERALRERLEQQKKDAERRRMVDEERRKIAEAARLREEAARVEAIRSAEVARVRAQVAQKTQLELQAQQHEHERRMDAMRRDEKLRRYQTWSIASSLVAVVAVLGGASLYFGKLQPDAERRIALFEARANAQLDRAERASADAEQSRQHQRVLERQLATTKKELSAARDELTKLEASNSTKKPPTVVRDGGSSKGGKGQAGKGRGPCKPGLAGDPMNDCL